MNLFIDEQKVEWHDCQKVLLNIALKGLFYHSMLGLVNVLLTCGWSKVWSYHFSKTVCTRCFVLKFVLHFPQMLSKIQTYSVVPSTVAREEIAAWIVGCSTITESWKAGLIDYRSHYAQWMWFLGCLSVYWDHGVVVADYYKEGFWSRVLTARFFCHLSGSGCFGSPVEVLDASLKVWVS